MKTLGLRHLALYVKDAQASKKFYVQTFGMEVEWQPDPQNVFLTSAGQDNLALHERKDFVLQAEQEGLDHFGFVMASVADVDDAYHAVVKQGAEIVKPPKKHRDGAYSFYMKDLDGYVIQVICHPPIIKALSAAK